MSRTLVVMALAGLLAACATNPVGMPEPAGPSLHTQTTLAGVDMTSLYALVDNPQAVYYADRSVNQGVAAIPAPLSGILAGPITPGTSVAYGVGAMPALAGGFGFPMVSGGLGAFGGLLPAL